MTEPNFIKRIFIKAYAGQLRKPKGIFALKVGNKMNELNSYLYDISIDKINPEDNEAILEIGFGNGKFFEKIFAKAEDLKIYGLDYSSEMVKAATDNNKSSVNSGKLFLKCGSSDRIPFDDNFFNKVFCINVAQFWENPSAHLKEIYRVLKPGGKFYTIIRTKESTLMMPFSKYGFTAYTAEEWGIILKANNLNCINTSVITERPVNLNNGDYKLESYCIISEK